MGENDPADYVRYVRQDLMGITREDLIYDVGRHVDDSVHNFERWGLPIWKQSGDEGKALDEGGKPVRSGRWQIMINGESYKWIVAEAAKKALGLEKIREHVFITRLITDKNDPTRVAGAAGFSVRDHKLYIYKFKTCLMAAGGAVNVFRPRSVGEGLGRAWYPVWNAGSTYAMAAECGAELTMMENRFVPARFKDGYGPVGAWFLLFKAQAMNAAGEDYQEKNKHLLDEHNYGTYVKGHAMGTCLRNHLESFEGDVCEAHREKKLGPSVGQERFEVCQTGRILYGYNYTDYTDKNEKQGLPQREECADLTRLRHPPVVDVDKEGCDGDRHKLFSYLKLGLG